MKIIIEATPEMFDAPINGQSIPMRVWKGKTEQGVEIEAYVLSIVTVDHNDHGKLLCEADDFMVPTRDQYEIDL